MDKIKQEHCEQEPGISLRLAVEEDIPNILGIDKSVVGTKLYHGFTGSEDQKKDFKENTFYLIEKDGKDVGYLAYSPIGKNRIYIRWLAVAKEFQGQGLAKQAIENLLRILKDIKSFELVTHPENQKAVALYKALGFKQIGEQMENYFNDGEPKIKMVLEK